MQPYQITPFAKVVLTGAGQGYITVAAASAQLLWPGAHAILGSDTVARAEILILADLGGGKFAVRLDDPSAQNAGGPGTVRVFGGGGDMSAFNGNNGYIEQGAGQFIFPYVHDGVVPRNPSAHLPFPTTFPAA